MRWLKRALQRLTDPVQRKFNARIDALTFQASIRAIQETQGLAHDSALRAMNEALAAYVPPTPWAEEVTQVLDSVVAEQFRLQSQVEELERLLREALAERAVMTDG